MNHIGQFTEGRFTSLARFVPKAVLMLTIVAFSAFGFVVYGYVASNGVCCADDSTNALVAKNLAFGKGYVNSIPFDGSSGLKYFDPQISTGPTLNVPAAALILIFGNLPWVPGFTTASISLLMLLAVTFVLAKRIGIYRACAYLLLLLCLLYNLTAVLHFEQWYSLLGEVPAALFCLLGAAVLAREPDRRLNMALCGALYGLAALTKLLAVLAFVPIAGWLLWALAVGSGSRSRRLVNLVESGSAFLLPSILFELWKVIALGPGLYVANVRDFIALYTSGLISGARSAPGAANPDPLHKAAAYSLAMYQHFGFSPLGLGLILLVIGVLICSNVHERSTLLFFWWLTGGAASLGCWWLLFSNGWPRYALMGLFLYFAALSCVVLVRLPWTVTFSVTVLLLAAFSGSYERLIDPVNFVRTHRYSQTERVANLLKTAAYLKTVDGNRPFVMGWWATAGDLEYVLPSVGNFIPIAHVKPEDREKEIILVRNKIWVDWVKDPEFATWEQRCDQVLLNAPPYLVSRCPAGSLTAK